MVPTADDVERFERELAGEGSGEAVLGGKVLTLSGLLRELATTYDIPHPNGPGHPARVWLAREATAQLLGEGRLDALAVSAPRPGFAPVLAATFDELEAAMILPENYSDVVAGFEEATEAERELGLIYERWFDLKTERAEADTHELYRRVRSAIRDKGTEDPWLGRPVFLYGFDDLTSEQRELVLELARATRVAVSVTYDPERPALEARARLKNELEEGIPPDLLEEIVEMSDEGDDTTPLISHVARNFFSDAERMEAQPGSGLHLLKATGTRSEAELVGSRVIELIDSGVDIDEIAVVLRSPARHGREWGEVFEGMGIPTVVEARVAARTTTTGRAMILLAQIAAGDAEPSDLVAYLRTPGRATRAKVDRLEREILTRPIVDLSDAEKFWAQEIDQSRDLFEISSLREAGGGSGLLAEAANLATMISQYPMRQSSPVASSRQALELRAGGEIARALDEVAALGPDTLGLDELGELISAVNLPLHSGPAHGRVRIASPYRLRAQRVDHLFVSSLQDREFPKRSNPPQLLSDELRGELRLPERTQPIIEERYLFAASISRPRQGLWLSWRSSDEEGEASSPSAFLEDVRDLVLPTRDATDLAEGRDPLFELIGEQRRLDRVVIDLKAAASDLELSRTLAAMGPERSQAVLESLDLPEQRSRSLAASLERAALVTRPEKLQPRDFNSDAVRAKLAEQEAYGATTLESYLKCPYIWLIGHEIQPDELSRQDGPLQLGSVAHAALEQVFGEQPGGPLREVDESTHEAQPRKGALAKWQKRVVELVDEALAERQLDEVDVFRAASVLALKEDLKRYLESESRRTSTFLPDESLNEIQFGREGDVPALELDGLRVHGAIDRIDLEAGADADGNPRGLVVDYKYSGDQQTTAKTLLKDSKLQAQLYALAARDLLEIDPAGSLYVALRRPEGSKPRGFLSKDVEDAGVPKREAVRTDFVEGADFEATLAAARQEAERIAADIRRGHLDREPNGGECDRYCRWQSICRIEKRYGESED